MYGVFGNSARDVGYSCMMVKLVKTWRQLWSATAGTTDPLAPFGVVTLAPSGTEGGSDIGTMRLAQTGSYGVLPNPAMPRTCKTRSDMQIHAFSAAAVVSGSALPRDLLRSCADTSTWSAAPAQSSPKLLI